MKKILGPSIIIFVFPQILILNSVIAQKANSSTFTKGQIIKLGEPTAYMVKKNKFQSEDTFDSKDEINKFYHIFCLQFINRYFWDGLNIQANDNLKQEENYYKEINENIAEFINKNNKSENWWESLKQYKAVIKIDSNSFSPDGVTVNNSLNLMIDTIIEYGNKNYLVAYWINELGYLDSPIENLEYSLFFSQTGKRGNMYTFLIEEPETALEKGEIILTKEKYQERVTLLRPIRATIFFITRSSKLLLIFLISLYCVIIFIKNRLSILKKLSHEIEIGDTVSIAKSRLVSKY
jgi:hypothetical protein